MSALLTTQDVLNDIEFELAQGAISRDELGQSIQAVRQYQSKLRTRLFGAEKSQVDMREALGQQFQVNDMLLTMLQEMAAAIQTQQAQLQRLGQMRQPVLGEPAANSAVFVPPQPGPPVTVTAVPIPTSWGEASDQLLQASEEIKSVTLENQLMQKLDVRPSGLPVIGGFLSRLRVFFHNLVLFYVNRMAQNQTAVNQTLAHWLLQTQAKTLQHQEEIALLQQQVTALQSKNGDQNDY